MAIDRRALLIGTASSLLGAGLACARPPVGAALYAAARKGPDGGFSAAIFTAGGRDVRAVALPGRGHDLTISPVDRSCVVFARRPGNFAIAFSTDQRRPPTAFTTPPDRHFYGHGVFSRDGRLLYTTENDFDGARGIIGIYDVAGGYRRIGEFASGGLGPHDLALSEGGRVLVVANGGLREHPDLGDGRRILNSESVATTLAYLDVRSGALLESHELGGAGALSLRHLDVAGDGTVIVGAQRIRDPAPDSALVYRHRRQRALEAFDLPGEIESGLSGYVSSIACDRAGEFVAVTSSRGALAVVIEVGSGRVARSHRFDDVSGVAPTPEPGGFLATNGMGRVCLMRGDGELGQDSSTPWSWDNHAVLVDGDQES